MTPEELQNIIKRAVGQSNAKRQPELGIRAGNGNMIIPSSGGSFGAPTPNLDDFGGEYQQLSDPIAQLQLRLSQLRSHIADNSMPSFNGELRNKQLDALAPLEREAARNSEMQDLQKKKLELELRNARRSQSTSAGGGQLFGVRDGQVQHPDDAVYRMVGDMLKSKDQKAADDVDPHGYDPYRAIREASINAALKTIGGYKL